MYVYVNYIALNFTKILLIELLSIAISYYLISLVTSFLVVIILYSLSSSKFNKNENLTILKKLEIVAFLFDRHYDDMYKIDDFQVIVEEYSNYKFI